MKLLSATLIAAAIGIVATPAIQAGEYDKFTKITVNEPVRLPSLVLQPGNYSLKLLDATGNRHVVEVQDENGKGMAIILALPNYRLVPKDKTVITYWESPAGQPRPIRAWFFPGDNFGQEFAYPKSEATTIAAYTHTQVPTVADSTASADLKSTKVTDFDEANSKELTTRTETAVATPAPAPTPAPAEVQTVTPAPAPEPQVIAQATPPAPRVDETPATPAAPSETPAQLPQTGSNLPLVGLVGVLSLAAFLSTLGRNRGKV